MIMGNNKGSFIAAGAVMWVDELKIGSNNTPRIKFSVSTHKNADRKQEATFMTAWAGRAEFVKAIGLAKWDTVFVAGTWSKSDDGKFINYNVDFIDRQEAAPRLDFDATDESSAESADNGGETLF